MGGGGSTAAAPPPEPATAAAEPVVFDVPALIGLSIEQVRETLGQPQDRNPEPTELQLEAGAANEWSNGFTREGQDLLVTFDPRTRRVIDLFLSGSDRGVLMQRGNLSSGAREYRIESVRALRDPSKITGITVLPRP